ncbi:MAG: M28 family metallopeptidase [Gammaproteobacteria bacterium]|nr:M28 family metallopeptidase [Gammaproteobacteria bacterium]
MRSTCPDPTSRTTHRLILLAGMLSWAGVTACGGEPASDAMGGGDAAATGIAAMSVENYTEAVRILSSDEFEGRAPSTPGEELTVAYLVEQFESVGLEPGNGDSFFQEVPLVALTEQGAPPLTVRAGDAVLEYAWTEDFVAWTKRVVESESIQDSEMVFVGYGIVAPEYGWNDYEGVDAAGKTVVMLVNDPGFATQNEALFRGNAMTYYGRWTYKFEEAARQGALGAIVVHEEAAAGYPWEVVSGSWTGPQFDQAGDDGNMARVAIEGWVQRDVAREIFAAVGHDFDAMAEAAARPGYRAVPLGASASVAVSNDIQRSRSKNVLALLRGSQRPEEYIIYTAHWDHFGRGPDTMEDPIFNGAFDNATGTAGLIELARAFAALPERPARSVAFLAVTAEEQGLLGSAYYAANPVYPTASTVATINLDGVNVDGPMNDITVVGIGASELDDYLERAAAAEGRLLRPDPEPEKGFYYRSDHFSFAKVGVPSLYADSGIDHVEHGIEWTLERRADYTSNRYHKVTDEFDPAWDLTGALDDFGLLFRVGYQLADSGDWPNWREGNEFRAIRDADRAGMD